MHAIVLRVLMIKKCKRAFELQFEYSHCHVLTQLFTTCYALNASDSIEENGLLEEKLQTSVTLPLSCTIKIPSQFSMHDNHSKVPLPQ